MKGKNINTQINDARQIAKQLNSLLREDAYHRLHLYQDYSDDLNARKWSPDLYRRCQLAEALCRKLDILSEAR